MEGPVAAAAKDSDRIHHHFPADGNTNIAAAEDGDDFNFNLAAEHVAFPEVDIEAAENGDDIPAGKILRDDAALAAPENVYLV